MSQQATDRADTAVRVSVTVRAPVERAFDVFTAGFDGWWPGEHHLGESELVTAVIEPRTGGRWYERTADGKECEWGRVLAYEPPHRLVLSWAIQPDWSTRTDLERASTIEVRFTAVDGGTTTVDVEHRDFERHGDGWRTMAEAVGSDGGWPGIVRRYAAAVEG